MTYLSTIERLSFCSIAALKWLTGQEDSNKSTSLAVPQSALSRTIARRRRRISVTDQNGKTLYGYDDADQLISVTDAASNVTTYGYDTQSNLTVLPTPILSLAYLVSEQLCIAKVPRRRQEHPTAQGPVKWGY